MSRPPPLTLLRHLLFGRHLSLSTTVATVPSLPHFVRPPTPVHPCSFLFTFRSFSSLPSASPAAVSPLAQTVSSELIKQAAATDTAADPGKQLDLADHLSLHFSDVRFNNSLLHEILNLSSPAGRTALDFFRWLVRKRAFTPNDESLSHLVAFFGRRHDFKSIQDVLVEFRRGTGPKTFREAIDRLVRAGRVADAMSFFDDMERDYGIKRDNSTLSVVVSLLCERGYGAQAEQMVRKLAGKIFPDEEICYSLVKGWCIDGRPDEAIRLMGEMARGGFEIGTPAYNAVLNSVCKLCRKKDPLRMQAEAQKVLLEMEAKGVPWDTETFHVLIMNLCKIRKTEDALKLLNRMSDWGCSPDAEIYLILIRSLYQAARVSEGDDMLKQMWSAGFKLELDTKECYGFLNILCGIERVEHAMKVFKMLKGYGFKPGVQTYELLMQKLCAHNLVDKANALFQQATAQGLPMTPKEYAVDPRYLKKPKEDDGKKKKRLTLPEKILMKRKRLKKLKLSFVKKPRKRRAY